MKADKKPWQEYVLWRQHTPSILATAGRKVRKGGDVTEPRDKDLPHPPLPIAVAICGAVAKRLRGLPGAATVPTVPSVHPPTLLSHEDILGFVSYSHCQGCKYPEKAGWSLFFKR